MLRDIITTYDLPLTAKTGIAVRYFTDQVLENGQDVRAPRRDTRYVLILLEKGSLHMQVDTQEHTCEAGDVLLVIPGQVHHITVQDQPRGWVVFFDPSLMPAVLYTDMHDFYAMHNALQDAEGQLKPLLGSLLDAFSARREAHANSHAEVLYHLLQAILYSVHLLAGQAARSGKTNGTGKPPLVHSFSTLLHQSFRTWKHTSEYAAVLNVSPGHLNDVVKRATGHPVSYHIQQVVVTEAKRLLFHTGMSVKEISHKLGYEDDNYFSRLFKKIAGQSPLHFRRQNRAAD